MSSEAIDAWIENEHAFLDAAVGRHSVPIGTTLDDKREIMLRPDRGSVLITGTSGGGKSTLATALLERLSGAAFQLCVFDPEGDYGGFADAVTFGDASTAVTPQPVLDAVRKLGTNVIVNLLGSSVEDRPDILASLFPAVLDIRAKYGRPHWILVDEAHHMLPRGGTPAMASTSTARCRPSSSRSTPTRSRPARCAASAPSSSSAGTASA